MAAGSTDRLVDTSDLVAAIDAYHERGAGTAPHAGHDGKLSHHRATSGGTR